MRVAWFAVLVGACAPAVGPDDDPAADDRDDTDAPTDPVDETDTDAPPPRARVVAGPNVACSDPDARGREGVFRKVTEGAWGAQAGDGDGETLFTGGGVAAADLDGDGLLDLLVARTDGVKAWRRTAEGAYEDVSHRVPATDAVAGLVPADVDGDGDPDLVLTRWGAPDQYWRNDGGTLVDATAASGITGSGRERSAAASLADIDRDGDLDLFLGAHGGLVGVEGDPSDGSALWLGHGDGTFSRGPDLPDAVRYAHAFAGGWHDLDRDGWLDLYVVADFGQHRRNALLWNRAGALVPDGGAAGLDVVVQGMGLGVGDLDADGTPDIAVAGWGNHRVMLGRDGRWYEAHRTLGVVPDRKQGQSVGWGSELVDLDADGDLDVVLGYGTIWNQDTPPQQPDELYRNDGGTFTAVGASWGFAERGPTRAILPVDADGDGWLDLLRGELGAPATLHLARCGAAAWTTVRLEQAGANRDAIGAEITLRAAGRVHRRTVVAGSTGILAGGPPVVHVGLGEATTATLAVRWPDGEEDVLGEVPLRRHLLVARDAP